MNPGTWLLTTAADGAGIFYNEAATTYPLPGGARLRLYLAPTNDFAEVIDPGDAPR